MRVFDILDNFVKTYALKSTESISAAACIFYNKTIRNVGNLAFFTFKFTLTDLENFGK